MHANGLARLSALCWLFVNDVIQWRHSPAARDANVTDNGSRARACIVTIETKHIIRANTEYRTTRTELDFICW